MYIYVYYICKQYSAARACSAQNFPDIFGSPMAKHEKYIPYFQQTET